MFSPREVGDRSGRREYIGALQAVAGRESDGGCGKEKGNDAGFAK